MRTLIVAVVVAVVGAVLFVLPAAALADAWYLMIPDGETYRHSGSYDTAAECRAGITERVTWNEALTKRLEAAINARRAKGETIADNDLQWMAYMAGGRVMFSLPFARCEVQCVGSR